MSRIDSGVAAQIGDGFRPQQTRLEQEDQARAVRRAEYGNTGTGTIKKDSVSADEVGAAVAQIQKVIEAASGRALAFQIDDSTKDVFVLVKEKVSGDVIRQIPSEEVMRIREHLNEIVGLFLDDKA